MDPRCFHWLHHNDFAGGLSNSGECISPRNIKVQSLHFHCSHKIEFYSTTTYLQECSPEYNNGIQSTRQCIVYRIFHFGIITLRYAIFFALFITGELFSKKQQLKQYCSIAIYQLTILTSASVHSCKWNENILLSPISDELIWITIKWIFNFCHFLSLSLPWPYYSWSGDINDHVIDAVLPEYPVLSSIEFKAVLIISDQFNPDQICTITAVIRYRPRNEWIYYSAKSYFESTTFFVATKLTFWHDSHFQYICHIFLPRNTWSAK